MGQTGFCENLRFPAVFCENLRFPAKYCKSQEKRKSAKISENRQKAANSARFVPFSLLPLIEIAMRALKSASGKALVSAGEKSGKNTLWTNAGQD